MDALVRELRPHAKHGLVQEGLEILRGKFASVDHVGPRFVADFEGATDVQQRDRLRRDAFERVRYLLDGVGFGAVQ